MLLATLTHMKYPELAAPVPTKIHRSIPTGIRQSILIGMYTVMAYPYIPSASAIPHSPILSHLVIPHSRAGTRRPYRYVVVIAVERSGRLEFGRVRGEAMY